MQTPDERAQTPYHDNNDEKDMMVQHQFDVYAVPFCILKLMFSFRVS